MDQLDRDELSQLLDSHFPARRWYRQRRYFGSALWGEHAGDAFESWRVGEKAANDAAAPAAMYFVVIAARDAADLPDAGPALSLLCDRDDREWKRIEEQASEVLRLDTLLRDRDASLDRQTAHIHHLEKLVAEQDAHIAANNAAWSDARIQLQELNAALASESEQLRSARTGVAALERECGRLERAIAAQERIIAYRQSARWWVKLPWLRVKLLWKRLGVRAPLHRKRAFAQP